MKRLFGLVLGMVWTALSCGPASAQQSAIVGTWMTTLNPNTPAIIYVTLSLLPNGTLQERFMNRQAFAYEMLGTYQFDAAHGALRYVYTDFQPKQLCSAIGCQPAPIPPNPLNSPMTAQISFPTPTQMIGTASDGTQAIWGRAQ
jgi:hypothetical protein